MMGQRLPDILLVSINPKIVLVFSIFTSLLLQQCAAAAKAKPQPISVPVNTGWFGTDGSWSPVNLRVGSPPQWVSVFPNTVGQETWVIGRSGCDDTFTCRNKRGGLFFPNESSTWEDVGFYALGFNPQLGYSGPGYYGYDNIALSEDVVAPSQVVAVVNTTQHWLGYMGLGVQETNFTDANKSTFLSTMVENQSLIPSHSYGYTAGAYYRLKGVPASLTLGGVDQNRFDENNISFKLSPDQLPVVALNNIMVSASPSNTRANQSEPTFSNPHILLETGNDNLFTIDSSTSFLWLPETACNAFASALGLVYNDTLEVYTYGPNSSVRDALVSWNLTFTFSVADLPGSSNAVDITLPFSAFDHALSYPFPNLEAQYTGNTYEYFPLRKAANNTQYTLGRVFLQETYLTVDYERGNFSISQAKFAADALTNLDLAGIDPPSNSNFTNPWLDKSSSLSAGAKVGIGVGSGVAALLVLAIAIFCLRRRPGDLDRYPARGWNKKRQGDKKKLIRAELSADRRHPVEAPADSSNTVYELAGNSTFELDGSDVGYSFYGPRAPKYDHGQDVSAYTATAQKLRAENSSITPVDCEGDETHPERLSGLPAYSSRRASQQPGHGHGIDSQTPSPGYFHVGPAVSDHRSSGVPSPLHSVGTLDDRPVPPSPFTDDSSGQRTQSHQFVDGSGISPTYMVQYESDGSDIHGGVVQPRVGQSGVVRRKFSWES